MNLKKDGRKWLTVVFLMAAGVLFAFGAIPAPGVGEKEFLVKDFSPQGEVKGRAEIKAFFNREAVTADKVGAQLGTSEMPFSFSPQITGTGKWLNASTFVFYPKAGLLKQASSYTASAKGDLRDTEGRRLSGRQTFVFNTEPLRFLGASQVNFNPDTEEAVFELSFSLPVSPARLRGYVDVTDKSSRAIDFKVNQGPVSRKVRVSVNSHAESDSVKFSLAKGLPTEAGPLGLEKAVSVRAAKILKMEVLDTNAVSKINNGEIYIKTAAPVDFSRAEAFIEIFPKTPYSLEPRDNGFAIVGNFTPQDRVKVTLKKGLPALSGQSLASEWSRAFIFPEKAPEVSFAAPGRILSPSGQLRLPIDSVNVDRINVTVWKLYENNIPLGMRSSWSDYPIDLSSIIADKTYKVPSVRSKSVRSALDLKSLIGRDKGVFLVIAQNEGGEWSESRQVINVTDLALTVKIGNGSAVAWVNSVKNGSSVSGVKVTLWSWANQPVAEGMTDKNGIVTLNLPKDGKGPSPVIATASKNGDTSFARFENSLYSGREEFETGAAPWPSGGYNSFCYTPRDIFRPGENIPVNVAVRGSDGMAPSPFPVKITMVSPLGSVLTSKTKKLSKEGTANALFSVPADAPTGQWSFRVSIPGSSEELGAKDVFVEEFTAPRLFIETKLDKSKIIAGESLNYDIASKYAFGSPASGLNFELEATVIEKEYTNKSFKGFTFTDVETKFEPAGFMAAEGTLDKAGRTKGTIAPVSVKTPSMAILSLRAGVMEEGGRFAYRTSEIPLYQYGTILGIALPEKAAPGEKLKFSVAAASVGDKPSSVKEVTYTFLRSVERGVTFNTGLGGGNKVQEDFIKKESGTLKLMDGKGSSFVTPSEGGRYLLRVSDKSGKIKASRYIDVYGSGGSSSLPDAVKMVTDKSKYKTGDVVKVSMNLPFSGRLMLSVETDKTVYKEVKDVREGNNEMSFKVTGEMKPNAWITAHLVRPLQGGRTPSRAFGLTLLQCDNSAEHLTVDIKPVPKLVPGKNNFSLTVKDSSGKGREAEVTVMLVDEAVLGLTGYVSPDPWKHFTALRALGAETYDLYNVLIDPESESTPLLTAGGGADAAYMKNTSLNPVQAKRFKMLSLAKTVRSGPDGVCSFTFVIPEFSGTARLTAVAVTSSASGSKEELVKINRDITIEPSLPRVLAPGDEITVPCSVFNTGLAAASVKLTVKTEGPVAAKGKSEFSSVIKKGASASFPLEFKALGIGRAKVTYTAVWEGGSGKSAIDIAVRPASPKITESGSFVAGPGKKITVKIPGTWLKGTFSGNVMLSAMPQITMAELARFLITYPHGCMEQTVSSSWPLLLQKDIAKAADPSMADDKAVRAALAKRVDKIISLQNYDGGFVRWQGDSQSEVWESSYGTHFLLEAKKAGINIRPEVLNSALTYVRRSLSNVPESTDERAWRENLTKRAYSCYVLALAKDAPLGWMESLRDKAPSLEPSARLLLASSYALSGQKKEAEKMLGKKIVPTKKIPGGNENYDSDLRNMALTLLAYTETDPMSASAAASAQILLKEAEKTHYLTTQEAGMSVLALAKYFRTQPAAKEPAGSLTVGAKAGAINEKERTVTKSISSPSDITVSNTGKASLFASWTAEGVPLAKVKNSDNGIEVRVKLTERNGKAAGTKIKRGSAVTADITVKPKAGKLREVVVTMPLPAGLEPENLKFGANGLDGEANIRTEARDDRIIIYIGSLDKAIKLKTVLRAVTEGRFAVPQISAECMYDPAVNSLSGGGRMEIYREK